MDNEVNYLLSFIPGSTNSEVLERTLTGRKDLVDRLEELVIESAKSGNKHQRLIIGPRGSGKTHVLKVLHDRLYKRTELENKLEIAYLIEEEYGVATFLDWIIRILRSFIRWNPANAAYLEGEIEKLKETPPADREKIASHILLTYIKGKTLLIIVENLENIFDEQQGFGKTGQAKFRDLIQQHPFFTIMASNQALFQDIQHEDKPFHNFFHIIHLHKLSYEEAMAFLQSIAEVDGNSELLGFLNKADGKSRIRAIYDLLGGNHRLLVTFYKFLKTDYIGKLSKSFMKTIDSLIPFYQSMMDLLSSQQQKIVQYLCQVRIASTGKDIARNCFIDPNTLSKQMTNLVRLKYVEASPEGRDTFYELAEPLLRICYEVKENRGGPIKLFIDFLGNLYSFDEIKKRYMYFHIHSQVSDAQISQECSQDRLYFKEALKRYFPDRLAQFKIDEFEKAGKDFQVMTYIEELEKSGAYHELVQFTSTFRQKDRYLLLKEGYASGKIGDIKKEKETARLLLEKNRKDIDALLLMADALQENKEYKKSSEYFQEVLHLEENNIKALNGIASNFLLQDKYEEAEQYFKKVLAMKPGNEYSIENAGIAVGSQNRHQDAYHYFKKLTDLKPGYSDGWRLLGLAQKNLKNIDDARTCYLKAIELDDKNWLAVEDLGKLYGNQGDYRQAYEYFKKLTELKPDYSDGWRLLGIAQQNLKNIDGARACYLKAIELDDKNWFAVGALGELYVTQGDYQKAYEYFKKLTELKPDYSKGWRLLGDAQEKLQNIDDARTCYLKAIELDDKNCRAVEALGKLVDSQGDHQKAYEYFKKLTELKPDYSEGWRLLGLAQDNLNDIDDARVCFLKAIELDDKNWLAVGALGGLFGNQGDHQRAYEYFKKLTELDPDYSEGWRLLGLAQDNLKNIDDARACYLKAIELDDKNRLAVGALGELYGTQGDHQKAYEYFKKLTELEPDYSEGWRLLGLAQYKLNNIDNARTCYFKAIELDDKNWLAVGALGELFGNRGDYQKTYEYFKKLTELKPDYSDGWRLLGEAHYNINNIDDARACYLKSIELDDKNWLATGALGELFGNKGDHQKAYEYFKMLTELKPDYSEGWRLLGEAQYNLKNIDDARACYLKAIELDDKNLYAVIGLALIMARKGDLKKAEVYIEKILKESKDDSNVLNRIGEIYRQSNLFTKAIPYYEQAKKIDSLAHLPYLNIVSCRIGLNDIEAALTQLDKALEISTKTKNTDLLIQSFAENLSTLFIHGSQANIIHYLKEALEKIDKYNYREQFFKAIPQALFDILVRHEEIETHRFEFIGAAIEDMFKENESMIMPLKFLDIGVRHLKKKEKNVLFRFTKEERNTFKKFVLDNIKKDFTSK